MSMGGLFMEWRNKFPFSGKKRTELMLLPEQLSQLARVCLDVQWRSLGALDAARSRGMQVRHELFLTWLVTYHVTQQANGIEHHLSLTYDGTMPPEFRESLLKDGLHLLAFCVRVSRLPSLAPIDVELAGVGVRRVLLVEQSKRLMRSPDGVPPSEVLTTLWSAGQTEAVPLESRLSEPVRSSKSGLHPAS